MRCSFCPTGRFLTGREPRGVDVYEMAMTPAQRKWQYPQSLYHFYRWTGEEYSNYAPPKLRALRIY